MSLTPQKIIDRARFILRDVFTLKTFSDEDMIEFVGDSYIWLTSLDQTSVATESTINLVEGTVQTLPDNTIALHDVLQNAVGTATSERIDGRAYNESSAIRPASVEMLRKYIPNLYGRSKTTLVVHTMYNLSTPREFLVYPPNDGNGVISIVSSTYPARPVVGEIADAGPMLDKYLESLGYYVASRCLQRDGEEGSNAQRSMALLKTANDLLAAFMATQKADTEQDGV